MADMLSTGVSALLAYKRALDTTGHNIANVNTEGYSRQRVEFGTNVGQQLGGHYIGNGVHINSIERLQERFVFDQILEAGARQAGLQRMSGLTSQVDRLFSDTATSMSAPLRDFFSAADGVAAEPLSTAARQVMLDQAEDVVARGRLLTDQLNQLESEANQQVSQLANDINDVITDLARLNRDIGLAEASAAGAPANDLRDSRDLQLTKLSEMLSISTVTQDDGSINVFTAKGQPLVIGLQASSVLAAQSGYADGRQELNLQTPSGLQPITSDGSGVLGGINSFRSEVLDPTVAQLGRVMAGLALAANEQQAQGVDLYGNFGAPLFSLPTLSGQPHSSNTGNAQLSGVFSDAASLGTENFELSFDGANWTARGLNTGNNLTISGAGTPADPLLVEGLSFTVSGSANAGDNFQVKAGLNALNNLSVALDDPSGIAAAAPIRSSSSIINQGNGSIDTGTVLDINDPNLLTTATIEFTDPNNFTINGSGPFTFTAGDPIDANGWRVVINGNPATGDQFTVSATPAGSSDNRNALSMANLGTNNILAGGTASVTGTHSSMIARIGSQARSADIQLGAQTAVRGELQNRLEAVSGVNLDEEAANLVKFQQSYQAAAQVIATADTLFQTLIAAVRR